MSLIENTSVISSGGFIVFEGIEGGGKTTQAKALQQWLEQQTTLPVILTREPGGTYIAERIRDLVLAHPTTVSTTGEPEEDLCSETELLLMMAARMQHYRYKIEPALQQGAWVICDRFIASSLAYQGAGRGLSQQMIQDLHDRLAPDMKPDITFVLDVDIDTSRARIAKRQTAGDRMESNQDDFFRRARTVFLDQAKKDRSVFVLNAEQPIEILQKTIQTTLCEHFAGRFK